VAREDLREYVKRALSPDLGMNRDTVDKIGVTAAHAALSGAFLAAVERRFDSQPDMAEVTALVERIRERYIKADSLPPMLAEALVRAAARGEDSLLEGMAEEDLTQGQIMLTYGIVNDLGLTGVAYEQFLTQAAEFAQEIMDDQAANG
jgi:hypothetical protein